MSAKSKALQAMAVIGIAAITYTLSTFSPGEVTTKTEPIKKQVPVVTTEKNVEKQKATQAAEANPYTGAVPGYCNPDESSR